MNDNKENNPYSFDSYNIISSDDNKKKEENANAVNDVILNAPVPPSPPKQPYTEQQQSYTDTEQTVQYTKRSPKQKGQAGALFWILLSILAIFDVLLFIGGSGLLFLILSLIVLVALFVTRKSISKGIIRPILCFVGAIIVTFTMFAFTGTGVGNGSQTAAGFSFSIENKDKADVVKEGFAYSVEQDTLKPIDRTTVFSPNDSFIYYSVFAKYLPENTEIVTKWYYEGNLEIVTGPQIMQNALKNQYYTTYFQKGENPFPEGGYKIELIMTKDGNEIFKCSDEFTVAANSSAKSVQSMAGGVLFEDSFSRSDSNLAGTEWQEFGMRNGTGNSATLRESVDTPWSIKDNTLCYESFGNGTYNEDFIQTVKEFPIDNTMVEFEIRGTASTMLGYVGPGAFWAPSEELRLGGFETVDGKQPLIGVQAFYGWETKGTKGLVFKIGGKSIVTDGVLAGINQNEFVKHTIILKDGKMIYQASNGFSAIYDLENKPEPGAKRHFSFDVRYYDDGVPFKTEIRNFKITVLE